jgi:nicotinate-nucleotide pyrophosphorylase (carboxylating)
MNLQEFYKIYKREIDASIRNALKEDKANSDISTRLLFDREGSKKPASANLTCKEDCVLAGVDIFKKVFRAIDRSASFHTYSKDGSYVRKGSVVLRMQAPIECLLVGERTALNYLQRMSGIATLTRCFVQMLKNKNAKILHTRKTTPNFRFFEIAAVKIGGGEFHRFDLSSSVLIKDNHIKALDGIRNVMDIVLSKKLIDKQKRNFEVEVKSVGELRYLLSNNYGRIQRVMLDNFPKDRIGQAVKLLKKHGIKIELSGGLNLQNFQRVQYWGIDYYSVGMLTHGYESIDFSLDF